VKFRNKPVVIEAVQWTGDNTREIVTFTGYGLTEIRGDGENGEGLGLIIPTLEGPHRASPGDWIICGVKGEHYPCKPDIFAATYEAVNDGGAG